MIFLLGGGGFVGSAFARLFTELDLPYVLITRENYHQYIGQSCDYFVNSNGNSKKFMADRDPTWEFDASVTSVARTLSDFEIGKYIHLSTGDVYPSQSSPEVTREDMALDPSKMSRYGLHKYLAETLVRGARPESLVFRMGGFVGPGLKKNAIFDMLNNEKVWLDRDSELQFISTDNAARLMWSLVEKDVCGEIVNLGTKGVASIGSLYERIGSKSEFVPHAKKVRFEINTEKLERLLGCPLPSTEDEIDAFLKSMNR